MKTIVKLALSRIASKKARSAVICGAIFLTIILFMTIVAIAANIFNGYSLMLQIANGCDYHGYLRAATFNASVTELRNVMEQSENIAEVDVCIWLSAYATDEEKLMSSSDYLHGIEKEEDLAHFFAEISEGTFPISDDEILVDPLYFPDAKVGDIIGLYYIERRGTVPMTGYAECKVSGILENHTENLMPIVFCLSDTLSETYGFHDQYTNLYFMFDNDFNLTGKYDYFVHETLAFYQLPNMESYGLLNSAYLASGSEALNHTTVVLILFSVLVIFFCSFLLIYNIYSIALTQDMRTMGLLNVIGTTHKQMTQMVCTESVLLFGITAPFGVIGGYFIGWKLLSPLLVSSLAYEGFEYQFSIWIPTVTLLLALGTLLWSATRPLGKMKTMTPIRAVDYSPSAELPKRYIRQKNFARKNPTPNAYKLAEYSVSRNRKKTVITAVSMSLSVILFMLISTLCDYLIADTEDNMQFADYVVRINHGMQDATDTEESTENLVTAIQNSVYTKETWEIRTANIQISTPQTAREALGFLRNQYKWFDNTEAFKQAQSGVMDVLVIGIPDDLMERIKLSETERLGDTEYTLDTVVYDGSSTVNLPLLDGGSYDFTYFHDGAAVKIGNHSYSVRRSLIYSPAFSIIKTVSGERFGVTLYLPESRFAEDIGEGEIYAVLVNAKDGYYDLMRGELESMDNTASSSSESEKLITIYGRMDSLDQMKQTVLAIQTVGYSLASMIFLVGILNIVNTSLSSVSERKREFAMMEAIGMTDSQFMQMLFGESLYSGGVAVLISVCFGFPMIWLTAHTLMNGLVSPNWLSGGIMLLVCIFVSVISGYLVFRLTKSASVVERIKVE